MRNFCSTPYEEIRLVSRVRIMSKKHGELSILFWRNGVRLTSTSRAGGDRRRRPRSSNPPAVGSIPRSRNKLQAKLTEIPSGLDLPVGIARDKLTAFHLLRRLSR